MDKNDTLQLQGIDKGISSIKTKILDGKLIVDEDIAHIVTMLKLKIDELNAIVRLVKKA